jgi:hypothetical protein
MLDTKQLYYYSMHQKKMMSGYISRVPQAYFDEVKKNYFLSRLCDLEEGREIEFNLIEAQKSANQLKVDYILVPKENNTDKGVYFLRTVLRKRILAIENFGGDEIWTLSTNI